MNRFIILLLLSLFINSSFAQKQTLEQEIHSILQGKQATIGVAVIANGEKIVAINNRNHYPMMSVYKFHLALAVLHHLDKNNLPLETEVFVTKSDLYPNTYSPMRDARPEGNYKMTVSELLKYSVSKSDNNACDILFKYIGGTKTTQRYIKSLGIKEISIVATENEMHKKFENQYLNWTTPTAAAELLEIFTKKELLTSTYQEFLENTLIETSTGANKIKALLPPDAIVGHKTGSSFRNEDGIMAGDNDIAFVRLPNGKRYSIAIFVTDSKENDETNASLIAKISKAVYDRFL